MADITLTLNKWILAHNACTAALECKGLDLDTCDILGIAREKIDVVTRVWDQNRVKLDDQYAEDNPEPERPDNPEPHELEDYNQRLGEWRVAKRRWMDKQIVDAMEREHTVAGLDAIPRDKLAALMKRRDAPEGKHADALRPLVAAKKAKEAK